VRPSSFQKEREKKKERDMWLCVREKKGDGDTRRQNRYAVARFAWREKFQSSMAVRMRERQYNK
jgi:hypothetical protein